MCSMWHCENQFVDIQCVEEWALHRNTLAETQHDHYFPVPVDLVGFSYDVLHHWLSSFFFMEVQ